MQPLGNDYIDSPSHSVWSAWIEIPISSILSGRVGRTLYGVRGLKLQRPRLTRLMRSSHSVWSAWIEIGPSSAYGLLR